MKKQPHILLFNPDQMRADALDRGEDPLYADVDRCRIFGAREFILNYNGDKPCSSTRL
jgi:hypothetical protein